jgi:hypothetical protein
MQSDRRDRTLNACQSTEVYQIDTRLQNACVYANLQAIAAWEELQLQPARFEQHSQLLLLKRATFAWWLTFGAFIYDGDSGVVGPVG